MSNAIEKEKFNMDYTIELHKLAQSKSNSYYAFVVNAPNFVYYLINLKDIQTFVKLSETERTIITEGLTTMNALLPKEITYHDDALKLKRKTGLDWIRKVSQHFAKYVGMINKELNELSMVLTEANMQKVHDVVKYLAQLTNIINLDPMDLVNNSDIIAKASIILHTMNFTSESTKLEDGLVAGFHELSTYDLLDLIEKQSGREMQIFIGKNVYKVIKHRNDPPVLLQIILLITGDALYASCNYEESAVYYSKLEVSSRLLPIRACFRLMTMRSFKCLPFVLHLTAGTARKNFNDLLTFTWRIFETAPEQKDYLSKEVETITTDLVTSGVLPKQGKNADNHIYFDGKLLVVMCLLGLPLGVLFGVLLIILLEYLHIFECCNGYLANVRPFSNDVCCYFILILFEGLLTFILFLYICVIFSVYSS